MYQLIYDLIAEFHGSTSESWFSIWSNIIIYAFLTLFIVLMVLLIFVIVRWLIRALSSIADDAPSIINLAIGDKTKEWRSNWKRKKKGND